MSEHLYTVKLEAEELVRLDGKVNDKAQAVVDMAKTDITIKQKYEHLSENETAMIARIIATAQEKGRLTYSRVPIRSCPCCKANKGYHKYPRSSRYHRKGDPNHDRPILISGYDLDQGFVTMKYTIFVGYCDDCASRITPVLQDMLSTVRAEIPKALGGSHYKRFDKKRCDACGWEGHEGEMIKLRTVLGDGKYPGECPTCGKQNRPFGPLRIKTISGFALVPIEEMEGA